MWAFEEQGGKPRRTRRKTLRVRWEPTTYSSQRRMAPGKNWTLAAMVESERSHHCSTSGTQLSWCLAESTDREKRRNSWRLLFSACLVFIFTRNEAESKLAVEPHSVLSLPERSRQSARLWSREQFLFIFHISRNWIYFLQRFSFKNSNPYKYFKILTNKERERRKKKNDLKQLLLPHDVQLKLRIKY